MKFTAKKELLIKKLSLVSRAISNKAILPVLWNFKLSLTSNALTILASNQEITIVDHIDVIDENDIKNITIGSTGDCLLPSRSLEILKKLQGEEVDFDLIDNQITISDGYSTYKVNSIRPEEYPDIDLSIPQDTIVLNFDTFKSAINQVAFAASTKENQNILTCVNFNLSNNMLTLSATDSSRLARRIIRNVTSSNEHSANVPAKVVQDLVRMLDNVENIIIGFNNNQIYFKLDSMSLYSTLLVGNYPSFGTLFDNKFTIDMVVSSKDVVSAMERLSLLFVDKQNIGKIKVSRENLKISAKSQDFGSAVEEIKDYEFDSEDFETNVDCTYIIQAIKAFNEDRVKFKFVGETKPLYIVSENNPDLVQIITPVRVNA